MAATFAPRIVIRGKLGDRLYPNKTSSGKSNIKLTIGVPAEDGANTWENWSATLWEDDVTDFAAAVADLEARAQRREWVVVSGVRETFSRKDGTEGQGLKQIEIHPQHPLFERVKRNASPDGLTSKMEPAPPRASAPASALSELRREQLLFINEHVVPGILPVWRQAYYPDMVGKPILSEFDDAGAASFLQGYDELALDKGLVAEAQRAQYLTDRGRLDEFIQQARKDKKTRIIVPRLDELDPAHKGKNLKFEDRVVFLTWEALHDYAEYVEATLYPDRETAEVL